MALLKTLNSRISSPLTPSHRGPNLPLLLHSSRTTSTATTSSFLFCISQHSTLNITLSSGLPTLVSLEHVCSVSLLRLHTSFFELGLTVPSSNALIVFAVGSHYVDDPRVLFPKEDGGTYGPDSAGWIFYHAFGRMVRHRLAPTELWDLQVSVVRPSIARSGLRRLIESFANASIAPLQLLVTFLQHSSQPGACWVFVGEGLRWAQDVGIHRSGVQRSADPVVNEGYRRALWCLYILDVQLSGFLGRQVALQDDTYVLSHGMSSSVVHRADSLVFCIMLSFDVGLPWDCDDAFWQDATPFQQPAGVPSTTSAFIWQIKLLRILSTALTSLVSNLLHSASLIQKDLN
jgi:hypothetical protein